jgi:hypothetical protein
MFVSCSVSILMSCLLKHRTECMFTKTRLLNFFAGSKKCKCVPVAVCRYRTLSVALKVRVLKKCFMLEQIMKPKTNTQQKELSEEFHVLYVSCDAEKSFK